jgi:predicted GNAT family acetyltransferase
METPVTVTHNPGARRYEAVVDGHLSVCEYELAEGRMIFTHTVVPPELRGRGMAEALVRTALGDARAAGRQVVPQCSYVARFIARHQEFAELIGPSGSAT